MRCALLIGKSAEEVEGIDVKNLTEPVNKNEKDRKNQYAVYKNIYPENYDDIYRLYHYAIYPHYLNNYPAVFAVPYFDTLLRALQNINDPPPVSCPLTGEKAIRHFSRMPQIYSLEKFKIPQIETETNIETPLDKDQEEAAMFFTGQALTIAPAGSGKTTTLIARIILLVQRGVRPDRILCITFTKKAQLEMRQRLINALGEEDGKAVIVKTYHALAYMLIKTFTNKTPNITTNRFNILAELTEGEEFTVKLENVDSYISYQINNLVLPGEDQPSGDKEKEMSELYKLYQGYLENNDLLDQDNLLLKLYTMLRNDKKVRHSIMDYNTPGVSQNYPRGMFQFVCIDETQDNNLAQDVLTRFLAAPHDNIFYVGDEDQLLYSFRGSSIDRILGLSNIYPNLKEIYLRTNYRSHPEIVNTATKVIEHNEKRRQKTIIPYRKDPGTAIQAMFFEKMADEFEAVAQKIEKLLKAGKNPGDIAILYRVNVQGEAAAIPLRRKNVPHYVHQNGISIFESTELDVLINHMKLLVDNTDREALKKCIRLPRRTDTPEDYIETIENHKHPLTRLSIHADSNKDRKLLSFTRDIMTASEISTQLPNVGVLVRYLRKRFSDIDRMFSNKEQNDRLNITENIAMKFNNLSEFTEWIAKVQAMERNAEETLEDKVQLMTVHSAKGMEFDTVFLVNCTDGYFPYNRAKDKDALEEERRIFYVGMTRAMNYLYVSGYENDDRSISPYLKEARLMN